MTSLNYGKHTHTHKPKWEYPLSLFRLDFCYFFFQAHTWPDNLLQTLEVLLLMSEQNILFSHRHRGGSSSSTMLTMWHSCGLLIMQNHIFTSMNLQVHSTHNSKHFHSFGSHFRIYRLIVLEWSVGCKFDVPPFGYLAFMWFSNQNPVSSWS